MSNDITAANRVADNQPDNDPGDESGQCTLTKKDMQIVPVRYAMVEEPEAERAEAVNGFSPVHGGHFRRSGIRPIRSGWLYIVHSVMPDQVQVFKVEPDGSGDEIILERKGSIEVLHCMVELTELHKSMLLIPNFRRQVMTSVGIGGFCHGTAHLLDPDDLPDVLADDHGEYQATPEAPDISAGVDAELDPGRYAWCDLEADPVDWQAASAGDILDSIQGGYQNDSAILVVEDIPARVKDWAQLWRHLAEQQGDWQDKYQVENFAARTIDGLMTLDFTSHAANAGQGDIPEWLGNAEEEDQADLLELANLCERYREANSEAITKEGSFGGPKTREAEALDQDIDQLSEELAEKLQTDAESVRTFVEQSEKAHFREVVGGHNMLSPNGIVDVIRQNDMENFLAYADSLTEGWQSAYQAIGRDLANLLPAWHDHAILLDKEKELHISFACKLEKYAYETLALCGQGDFLSQHYMGSTPTAAHLLHYQPTQTFIERYLSESDGIQKALTQAAALMAASGALSSYQEWSSTLEQQIGLRFRSVAGLSDEAVADIAGEVSFKEKMLGEAVVKTLLDETQQLELPQRFANLAGMLPKEGQLLMFAERLGLLEAGWDIPDQTVLGKLQQSISQSERSLSQLQQLEQEMASYYQERKAQIEQASKRGTSEAHRRAAEQYNANNIREKASEITRQQQLIKEAFSDLAEHSFPANESGSHAIKAGGLSQSATQAALAERTAFKQLADQPPERMRSTLDTLIRNEQNEVSVARAMGVLVNGSLSALGAISACIAIKDMISRVGHEDLLEHVGNAGSQTMATAAAVMAIREMVVDARHRKLYEGRAFQQVAQAELRAAAGSPAQLERWARVANKAMGFVAGLGGVAGIFETIKQAQKVGRAETQAERLASQVALVGASGTALGGTFLGGVGLVGKVLGAPAAQWRLLLLQFAGPVGWFVAVSTLLLVVGDVLASRFSLSPVQSWCQRSYWGRRSEFTDLEAHKQELGKLNGSDPVVERQGVATRHSGPGPGPAPSDLAFRLTLPGGQLPDEENFSFGLWGVSINGAHQELTQDVLAYSHQASERNGAGVTYHFAPEALTQFHFVRLVVGLQLNGESATQVYELHRRGRSLPEQWRRVDALTDSFFSSVKIGTWPSMPLTPWAP